MKLFQLSGSFLTATALFAAIAPAYAGPFDLKPAGVFGTPVLTGPTTPPVATPGATSEATKPTDGAGSEVNALGTHQSWVDPKNLAKDPRALCSDIGLGSNTTTTSTKIALSASSKDSSNSASSKNDGGGGGFSVLGIVGANGSGSTQHSNKQAQSRSQQSSESRATATSTSNVQVGRNCDAFVQSAAARDMNYEDNLTKRYEIKTGRRGQQVDNLLDGKK
ncbi:MAG TPA: hypothetical protein V6C63_14435 [Allocoleopsis sp.]